MLRWSPFSNPWNQLVLRVTNKDTFRGNALSVKSSVPFSLGICHHRLRQSLQQVGDVGHSPTYLDTSDMPPPKVIKKLKKKNFTGTKNIIKYSPCSLYCKQQNNQCCHRYCCSSNCNELWTFWKVKTKAPTSERKHITRCR